MKKILFALFAASAMLLSSCEKDETESILILNDKTYTDISAKCIIESNHFFHLQVTAGEYQAYGMCDTPATLDKTVTINEDFGYGDRLFMSIDYHNGDSYEAMPASGTQTIKKKDKNHYHIDIDTKDENGKVYKLIVDAQLVDSF
ncbi:MAG: hypothetical protein J5835_03440 [Bacteroidales bacterium]|nr:hypothetical protein [Bacteroidales bacterium]